MFKVLYRNTNGEMGEQDRRHPATLELVGDRERHLGERAIDPSVGAMADDPALGAAHRDEPVSIPVVEVDGRIGDPPEVDPSGHESERARVGA